MGWINEAARHFKEDDQKQRLFTSLLYAAKSWDKPRRIIVKAEHIGKSSNPRFVITNLPQTDRYLYDKLYCARGDMEKFIGNEFSRQPRRGEAQGSAEQNRIKDQQPGLFAHRTSSHHWWSNPFRHLLSGLAYVLLEGMRRLALTDTVIARATPQTIRLTLFKIGAVITRNTRRIKVMMSSACPHQDLFKTVALRLNTS